MSHDFKVGDDAWYFEFPEDGCGGFDVSAINLCVDRNLPQWSINHGGYLYYAYKSRAEALEAIIARIEQINDEVLN